MDRKFIMFTQPSPNKALIRINGEIGGFDWEEWKYNNTGEGIRKELDAIKALNVSEIDVLITSYGGYVDEALQIHDALKSHPAKVTTIVQGFCASAATIVALAGDVRKISPNALFLIHKCKTSVYGANENRLEEELEAQKVVNETILNMYRSVLKPPKTEDDLIALFNANNGNGKWITAEEAIDFGFSTELFEFDDDEPKVKNVMARFLNYARSIFEPKNNNPLNSDVKMKNFKLAFIALAALLEVSAEREYNESEGVMLSVDELKKIDEALSKFEALKQEKAQLESEKESNDALINTLTAERDSYKAKYEAAPATVTTVSSVDVSSDESVQAYVNQNETYKKFFEEN